LDGAIEFLIEVKSIGTELKEAHTKQAVDYSANQGTDWVILTNGEIWRVYKVTFGKPIGNELVLEINFSQLIPKKPTDTEVLYHLTREGWLRSALGEFHTQQQALSRYFMGAMIMSQPILDVMRRELRRLSPDVKVDTEQIKTVLMNEVLKREVLEGEKFEQARKKISKSASKPLRVKPVKATGAQSTTSEEISEVSDAAAEEGETSASGVNE
jgi:hypothetical protein